MKQSLKVLINIKRVLSSLLLLLLSTDISFASQDIIVDFGSLGLWGRINNTSWLKLHNASPGKFVVGDVDGNGQDDIIAEFLSGSGGVFVKRNLGGWVKLHNQNPEAISIGDLDNNGLDDVIIDFGSLGLWARMNNSNWLKLNNTSPTKVVSGDVDGNGADDVVAVFSGGVFIKRNLGGWVQLHNQVPQSIVVSDLDNNGSDDVVVDFGSIGLWARMNDSSWLKLHNTSPTVVATGDVDGNGANDVIAAFSGSNAGLWQKKNLGGWSKLSSSIPDALTIADMDGNGQDDIVADFGSTLGGIFIKLNEGGWNKLHNTSPDSMASGNIDGDSQSAVGSISGILSDGVALLIDESNQIVDLINTAGLQENVDTDSFGGFDAHSFTFSNIPVNTDLRMYFIKSGVTAPVYFQNAGGSAADTNVFSLTEQTDVDLGLIIVGFGFYYGGPFRVEAEFSPVINSFVDPGPENTVIPVVVSSPPTSGMSLIELNAKGKHALEHGWLTGARTYFNAASTVAGNSVSNEADTARFMYAMSRVAAIGFDTLSDGNSADMNRIGDVLDRSGYANDERRASPTKLKQPALFASDSPEGNEIRDFIYTIATNELQGALQDLEKISQSFNTQLEGDQNQIEEIDYGDVLFFMADFRASLTAIAILAAYDISGDIDDIINKREDANLANDVTIQSFLADSANLNSLKLTDTNKLTEAKNHLVSALMNSSDAIDEMDAETDNQLDDLVTLDKLTAIDVAQAKDFITDAQNSISGINNRFDQNDQDVTNDLIILLDRFFGIGIDFRGQSLIPGFIGNNISTLFPDATFNGVILTPNLNEDVNPSNGIPDVAE